MSHKSKKRLQIKATNYNSFMMKKDEVVASVNNASYMFASSVYEQIAKLGIRPSYRLIMNALCENDSLTQLELVEYSNLKAPTISITLRSMENDGIVSREKKDDDRRETHVCITENGRSICKQLNSEIDKIQDKMLAGFTDSEKKQLKTLLDKVCDNLS